MSFATVGTVVRFPSIVPWTVPNNSAIVRGQAVVWDLGQLYARPATTGDAHIYGHAVSDADLDLLEVFVAIRGGFTISVAPVAGQSFVTGALMYVDIAGGTGKMTNTSASNLLAGFCVNGQKDSLGNYEMGFFEV